MISNLATAFRQTENRLHSNGEIRKLDRDRVKRDDARVPVFGEGRQRAAGA